MYPEVYIVAYSLLPVEEGGEKISKVLKEGKEMKGRKKKWQIKEDFILLIIDIRFFFSGNLYLLRFIFQFSVSLFPFDRRGTSYVSPSGPFLSRSSSHAHLLTVAASVRLRPFH